MRPEGLWSIQRSPGSRTRNFRTCQGLRPRRVGRALAVARPAVLPSDKQTSSALGIRTVSRLDGWPVRSPADASPTSLANACARLGADVVRYSFTAVDLHHLLLAGLPAHLLPPAFWTLTCPRSRLGLLFRR